MYNKVLLIGNLGKDPEIRRLESGNVVARFPVATNENYRDKTGNWQTITEWHDVVAWRNLAERAERDLKKGSLVFVEGKITKRKWQDKEGNDRYSTEVIANMIRPLERRESMEGTSPESLMGGSSGFPSSPAVDTNKSSNAGTPEDMDDDLPF